MRDETLEMRITQLDCYRPASTVQVNIGQEYVHDRANADAIWSNGLRLTNGQTGQGNCNDVRRQNRSTEPTFPL